MIEPQASYAWGLFLGAWKCKSIQFLTVSDACENSHILRIILDITIFMDSSTAINARICV